MLCSKGVERCWNQILCYTIYGQPTLYIIIYKELVFPIIVFLTTAIVGLHQMLMPWAGLQKKGFFFEKIPIKQNIKFVWA